MSLFRWFPLATVASFCLLSCDLSPVPEGDDVVDLGHDSFAATCTSACPSGQACDQGTCVAAPKFDTLYTEIFKTRCGPCHSLLKKGGLSLKNADTAYMSLYNQPADPAEPCKGTKRVVPGDPQNSILWQKLDAATVKCGKTMPKDAAPLTAKQVKDISLWIAAGALR